MANASRDIASSSLTNANVIYDDLVKDPIGTIQGIYKHMGWTFTEEYLDLLKVYLLDNKQKREHVTSKQGHGDALHFYSPESYGLTEEQLTKGKYSEYCKMYNIPMSKN